MNDRVIKIARGLHVAYNAQALHDLQQDYHVESGVRWLVEIAWENFDSAVRKTLAERGITIDTVVTRHETDLVLFG